MPDDSQQLGQDDIEALLAGAGPAGGGADEEPAAESPAPADASFALGQDEIEALISGGGPPATATAAAAPEPAAGPAGVGASPAIAGGGDIEMLLNQAQSAIESINEPGEPLPDGVAPFRLEAFGGTPANPDSATLELVRDVQLDLKIELGRTRMPLEDVLRLRKDAVVTLDKLAGDPVDVYVNGRLIARGEVLVLSDNFCVRVTELIVGDAAVA